MNGKQIEEIAERYAKDAQFQRKDVVMHGNIEVPYWEHNVKELIFDAITEATNGMWTDEDMYRASRHGVDWVMSEITDELHIERFHQWLTEYKEKKSKIKQ